MSAASKLLSSWAIQYLGWFSITEVVARIALEGGFLVLLTALGFPPLSILVGWIIFHTLAWVLIYGGFAKVWGVFGVRTTMDRLRAHLEDVTRWAERQRGFKAVYVRGSAASGEWNELSDVDILVVPQRHSLRAILSLWAVRARSAVRVLPLEAWWIDDDRYVPFRCEGAAWRPLYRRPEPTGALDRRLARRGILVTLSGMDGSGKTTAARHLVSVLESRGYAADYFYGHRISYQAGGTHVSFAIGLRFFWRHVGRSLVELDRHPRVKALFDALTLLDYLLVLRRLSAILAPGKIVITDRYVADAIAYLRFLGATRRSIEGLMVGASVEPDLSFLFDIDPGTAFGRKQEQTLEELYRFAEAYADLRGLLRFVCIDARDNMDGVRRQLERALVDSLGIATPGFPTVDAGAPLHSLDLTVEGAERTPGREIAHET